MPADNQNGAFPAGDAVTLVYTIKDRDNAPMDLASAEWTLSRGNSAPPLVTKATGTAGVTLAEAGDHWTLTVDLGGADTDLARGKYHQRVKVVDDDGKPATVTRGLIELT